jgi:hypothetical protein
MNPDLTARLRRTMRGETTSKTGVTPVTGVTAPPCYASKSPELRQLRLLRVKNSDLEKDVFRGVTAGVTAPLETVQPASDALPASLPSVPVVASLKERRASVALLLDAMADENERRRGWWRDPVEGWREGRLVIRSALTGEANVLLFPKRGRL